LGEKAFFFLFLNQGPLNLPEKGRCRHLEAQKTTPLWGIFSKAFSFKGWFFRLFFRFKKNFRQNPGRGKRGRKNPKIK